MGSNRPSFHKYIDLNLRSEKVLTNRVWTTKTVHKDFIIQERALSYRFTPHFHPYVGALVNRLSAGSIRGLQEADTDYALDPMGRPLTLPGSIKLAIQKGGSLVIPAQVRVILKNNVLLDPNGTSSFSGRIPLKLATETPASVEDLTVVMLDRGFILVEGQRELTLAQAETAVLSANTALRLTGATQAFSPDGNQISLPAGTECVILTGGTITLPIGTTAQILDWRRRPVAEFFEEFFEQQYKPNPLLVEKPYPVKDLDFSTGGAYSAYNWELFYHIPLTIAIHLSRNQRFEEAQRWFHYIFDPTDNSEEPSPERFWKVRPFQYTEVKRIEQLLVNLQTEADQDLVKDTVTSINKWKSTPFRPYAVARFRHAAFMYKAVMAYLDNLIAWGDSLFRQDSREAINEAAQLYVLAANILGTRPQVVPRKASVRPATYAALKTSLDLFSNALAEAEPNLPMDLLPHPPDVSPHDGLQTLESIGKTLYFCVPKNDKLLTYWDIVADRLFKIRNSLNIQGVFRQLALFEPPIDPALLARAAAAGLDVAAIVNGLNQPLPLVRFAVLIQKASELAQEVKSLGNTLLSAMEKEDGENLSILRAKHERLILQMVEQVRYAQVQESSKAREGLIKSLALAIQRYTYYEMQLGKKPDEIANAIPELEELDKASLEKMKFAMKEGEMLHREVAIDIAQDLGESGGKVISSHERLEFLRLRDAQRLQDDAASMNLFAKVVALIPEFGAQAQPVGIGAATQFGGRAISTMLSLTADASSTSAGHRNYEANRAAKIGSYGRREQDWAFQSSLASGEITQMFKQLRAAQIREAIAELELKNHRQQMKHADEIERFLNENGTERTGKKANKDLYLWMKREVKALYSQCFQFAFDVAKKAERALQHELGNSDLTYVQFGYLAGKEGLLAGEKLYFDVKRMEMAYHDHNHREYELAKHVSLLQLDPIALLHLRATGQCTISLPEELFDMDGPGQYFRRIKTVSVSVPCVSGPFTSINCKLSLLKSAIRRKPSVDGEYHRSGSEDDRFSDHFGMVQSIVTSSGQNDSGLFEANLRDERLLPFEYAGVISEWRLELPANPSKSDPRQFDYDTISDVILHLRYTAREGGELLRQAAKNNMTAAIEAAAMVGSVRLFSVRHDFPSAWAKFKRVKVAGDVKTAELQLNIGAEHYPFWSRNRLNNVIRAEMFAKRDAGSAIKITKNPDGSGDSDSCVPTQIKGLLRGELVKTRPDMPISTSAAPIKFHLTDNSMDDLWLTIKWGK